ncbi:type I polyketide synthase [Brenneria tiliae]|uniref:SDR family NAD(P)-dependent oxidoreductase n=1 Tax=Brenneria tiliae TaxID=2914984 RepID=A0ABT0MT94_9GAMM|nr:type I polyketide synthase [Brenneria tiliae]MCL2893054.1 SDR family NAD(P)-dependent oxidoreductase [Brenneria tiliae]
MTRRTGKRPDRAADKRPNEVVSNTELPSQPATGNANERIAEALRNSLLVNEQLKRSNQKLNNAAHEPIAIVAMGCRLPGGVQTPEQLWQLVASGTDAVGPLPDNRGWNIERMLGDDPALRQAASAWQGGFLADAAGFDAGFFRISDREALAMDPQQRLLLETAWEVIERAGILPAALKNSQTGVFIGSTREAYTPDIERPVPSVNGYRLQGSLPSIASGRIAFTLGLNGPAITVDTACSSSLTALHLAIGSLRTGECSLAIAGGATVIASPEVFVEFTRQGGLAADGRCKAFSDSADGTGFSEGVGLLLLERLSDAVQAGHPVLAVIRGSALNQDGASNGLTAPNGPAQERVIRQALANAGLQPSDVDAVEAHGTGTTLGDPIEANALINTYGRERPEEHPLWLGSLKSNIGHVQLAAGVAGVIKMVMAIRHAELPKTLYADVPSSKVEWSQAKAVRLLTEPQPWPDTGRPRRAAVSSFGFSGTNAHLILEQAPPTDERAAAEAPSPTLPVPGIILPLSAASPGGLRAQAAQLSAMIANQREADLAAIAYSLATTRTHFDYRAVITAADRDELLAALDALANDQFASGVIQGVRARSGNTAFVFSGQGSQWPTMGRGLYAQSPVFAQELDKVCAHLDPHLSHPLKAIMFADRGSAEAELLDRTDFTQAALFAFEVALYRVVEHLGPAPDFVAGHSIGEIAAAHVAGVLSLADAARFVAVRGRLMQSITAAGAMFAIEAGEEEILPSLSGYEDKVAVAALNSPASTVISGDEESVRRIAGQWQERGQRTHRLRVSHAFHSPHIDTIVDELRRTVAKLDFRPPAIPIISTVTGVPLTTEQACSPDYWAAQARRTVRFADTARWLQEHHTATVVEIGPDAVLTALGRANINTAQQHGIADIIWIPTLRKDREELRPLIAALAGLHAQGLPLDWKQLLPHTRRVALPTYPFQQRSYWVKAPPLGPTFSGGGLTSLTHAFLDAGIEMADRQGWIFTGSLCPKTQPWLYDHIVNGTATAPGAMTAELIQHAGTQIGYGRLDSLIMHKILPLPDNAAIDIQLRIGAPETNELRPVNLYFRLPQDPDNDAEDESSWQCHATGMLAPGDRDIPEWPDLHMQVWPPTGAEPIDLDAFYEPLDALGPSFRRIKAAWQRDNGIYIEADLSADDPDISKGFDIHPTLLDAGMQSAYIATAQDIEAEQHVQMLFSISGLSLYTKGVTRLRGHLMTSPPAHADARHSEHSLRLFDDTGRAIAVIDSVVLRSVDPQELGRAQTRSQRPYRLDWRECDLTAPPSPGKVCWIIPQNARFPLPVELPPASADNGVFSRIETALDTFASAPGYEAAVFVCAAPTDGELEKTTHCFVYSLLDIVQMWLADARTADCPLVVVTEHAVAADEADDVPNLAQSPVWGLLRTAQHEHPGRFILIDIDEDADSWQQLPAAIAIALAGEPQLALRRAQRLVPRLAKSAPDPAFMPLPNASSWRLTVGEKAGDGLGDPVFTANPASEAPLSQGQVRVAVRAAGINDRPIASDDQPLADDLAGVVIETGPDVSVLRRGDRVMGMAKEGVIGSLAITDERYLTRIPADWTFAQAATVPSAFLAAWQSLVDEAALQPGDAVLVHAAESRIGMAAILIAQCLGAEVYATAHPAAFAPLRKLGLDDSHLASSQDPGFGQRFADAARGRGIDVILHSLEDELTDASLRLLAPGGRLIDNGKTERRDPDRIAGGLAQLAERFANGSLRPLPQTFMDVRYASRALRLMRNAAHTGGVVLTIPRVLDANGTVLITGGTGTLGTIVARHLAAEHGIRHILLASRRGPDAPGAAVLLAELTELGAQATIAACDIADPDALAALLDAIPAEHPLIGVIHTAGTVDPAEIQTLTPVKLDSVLRPKVDAAWHLHRLTRHLDLAAFVLYSSAVSILAQSGQSNYAAANAFLDALAYHRRHRGLPANALAWGMWQARSGMGEQIGDEAIQRIIASGQTPIPTPIGLTYLDAALGMGPDGDHPLLIPARLNLNALRSPTPAPLLSELITPSPVPQNSINVAQRLADMPDAERDPFLLDLVIEHAAAVLNHPNRKAIRVDSEFRALGFDSLTSVEISNRLAAVTGLRLSATAVFDYLTPAALTKHLSDLLSNVNQSADTSVATANQRNERAGNLDTLLRRSIMQGQISAGLGVLVAAARLRSSFATPEYSSHIPEAAWLRREGQLPLLICLDSFIPAAANLTYQRLSIALKGRFNVAAVPLPGYRDGAALPATADAAAETLASAVENCAKGRPFTLVGFSTGGLVSHAAARSLEARGIHPDAVVLVDSFPPSAMTDAALSDVLRDWAESKGEFWSDDDDGLTAMAWYLDLFGHRWTPSLLETPLLLIQAADQPPSVPTGDWVREWQGLVRCVTTPGKHFDLLTKYSVQTAQALAALLDERSTTAAARETPLSADDVPEPNTLER